MQRRWVPNWRKLVEGQSGAVSVDWVILTGAAVVLAVFMMSTMNSSTSSIAVETGAALDAAHVAALGRMGGN